MRKAFVECDRCGRRMVMPSDCALYQFHIKGHNFDLCTVCTDGLSVWLATCPSPVFVDPKPGETSEGWSWRKWFK